MVHSERSEMAKKVYVENLGCAKNQVDAEVMLKRLADDGFERTEDATDADLIIVNTCGFIEKAREESVSTFFSLRKLNPTAKFIVGGCLAQRYSDELYKDLPEASAIFGNRDLSRISDVAHQVLEGRRTLVVPAYPDPDKETYQRGQLLGYPGSAYLKISEGCNHWCSYCAIPLIRGPLRSRPLSSVQDEMEDLVSHGVKEINLIAQDLAAYGKDWDGQSHFRELLDGLMDIPGSWRMRMLYIHPDFFPDWLPSYVKEHDRLLPYFDLPAQHADKEVLAAMGRTGDPQRYLDLVRHIRDILPDAVIRTTLMVGFPGEDAKAFATLRQFVIDAQFDWMGAFVYSREEGTKAYRMRGEKEHDAIQRTANRRKKELETIQDGITQSRLKRFVGRTFPVLLEEEVNGEDMAIGRIYSQAPEVDGLTVVLGSGLKAGQIVTAGIRSVNGLDLEAVAT